MIRNLLKSVREYKALSLITFLLIVGEVIIECLIPFITARLVNQIKAGIEMDVLIRTGLILILMAVVSLSFGGGAGYTSAKASAGFAKNVRRDLFVRVQDFSFENIDRFSSASLITRLTTDIQYVQMSYLMTIRAAVRAPLMFIFAVTMAYIMGGSLAMTFVIVIPILILGLFGIAKLAMPAFRRVFKKYDKLNESVEENIRAMRIVKGFTREEYEKEKFGNASDQICKEFTHAEKIVAVNMPLMRLAMYFNAIFVLTVGSRIVITSRGQEIDVGQMSAMLTYSVQILFALMMISMIYVMLTISYESIKRISEVLAEKPSMEVKENALTEVKDGSVEFHDVSFKYSEGAKRYSLQDVDLRIDSGMTVGVIGGTGSGKSTFVQLIPRLYDVTEGQVKVGGVDVRDYDLESLRDNVAMVLQKNQLFSGSIKDNLRWGNANATDEEMVEACKLAQADGFINEFKDGYDTMIEQGGTNVSGGQKQRLCIARALLKRPKILILDDSTSAVDTKTDALIRKGFKEYIPETTKIIIAQRIASVQDADLIVVLDNGRVVSVGKHEELLEKSDIYREVFEEQTHGARDFDEGSDELHSHARGLTDE